MEKQRIKSLKQKYGESFLSKSSNPYVLDFYELILKELNNGFNYWEEEYGAQDFTKIFENQFTVQDYNALNQDLSNWSPEQLERFTQGIIGDYSSYLKNDRTFPNHYYSRIESVQYRLNFILELLKIEKSRNLSGDFWLLIYYNIDFLYLHFEMLLEHNKSNFKTIKRIVELLNITEGYNPEHKELIELIKTAQKTDSTT